MMWPEFIASYCGLIKRISPKICILCVRVKINKRSFEPFCVWISQVPLCVLVLDFVLPLLHNYGTFKSQRETDRQRETGRQTDRQTDRQTERERDRQTDRQTDRQRESRFDALQ